LGGAVPLGIGGVIDELVERVRVLRLQHLRCRHRRPYGVPGSSRAHPRRSGARRGTRLRRLLRRLGCGDIGTVYLSELRGGGAGNSGVGRPCWFPMKVMDKAALEGRRKLSCAQAEREILLLYCHKISRSINLIGYFM